MTLNKILPGQTTIVEKIIGTTEERRQIMDMGIIKNSKIVVEKYAPLGDPMEIIVRGTHLSLREQDARKIWVEHLVKGGKYGAK